MKEFDFRFPGLSPIHSGDDRNLARVQRVRAAILTVTEGFTEIPPGVYTDLVVGDGMGYIVALETSAQVRVLNVRLSELARRWGVTPPVIIDATRGPRRDYCFFLIPDRANPGEKKRRRPLFSGERWRQIQMAIKNKLSHPIRFVYGEWSADKSAASISTDLSRIYVVKWESEATEAFLKEFLQTYVFDGGKECDQICLYLSLRGENTLVRERGADEA